MIRRRDKCSIQCNGHLQPFDNFGEDHKAKGFTEQRQQSQKHK